MHEFCSRFVDDAVSGGGGTQAIVDVVIIQRKRFIEAAGFLEDIAPRFPPIQRSLELPLALTLAMECARSVAPDPQRLTRCARRGAGYPWRTI